MSIQQKSIELTDVAGTRLHDAGEGYNGAVYKNSEEI
jgi:hypothetical protein